jgi:hypothetical protein
MGTSTVHRSPNTSRWRLVNNLYEDRSVGVDRLLAEVFNAAAEYPAGLADLAVLRRVEVVLRTAEEGKWRDGTDLALATAREAVQAARAVALDRGTTSFYGDLADRALHATLVIGAREPASLATSSTTLTAFLRNLVGVAVDHLVSRDLSAHLGKGRVAGAADAIALRRSLVGRARDLAGDDRFASVAESAASTPAQHWGDVVSAVWAFGSNPRVGGGERIAP